MRTVPSLLTALALLLLSCGSEPAAKKDDPGNGRPCVAGVVFDGGGSSDFINSQALECPFRFCLQKEPEPGATASAGGAMCTSTCTGDADCAGSSALCPGGFTCKTPMLPGRFACQTLCLCKALVGPGPRAHCP